MGTAATEAEERNKGVLRGLFVDAYNPRRFELVDNFAAPDIKLHTHIRPGPEGLKPGREGLHEMIRWIAVGWPTSRVTVDEMIAEGDLVAARFTFSGTHGGWLHGNPPTGRDAAWNEMFFGRIEDGKVAELWHELNILGILQKVEVLPPVWEMGRIPRPLLRLMKLRKRMKRRFLKGEQRIDAWRTAPIAPQAAE